MKAKLPVTNSDFNREAFKNYLLKGKSLSTTRGYLSALTKASIVGSFAESLYGNSDVFEILEIDKLEKIYSYVLKDSYNILSHSRFSAALRLYVEYVKAKQ